MSDGYPEYLNPFAEEFRPKTKKLSVKNSFRELKKSLRQSFRIKKKDDLEISKGILKKNDIFEKLPVEYVDRPLEALPRSRFRERVSRFQDESKGPNPFEADVHNQQTTSTVLKKRSKKRAPLPPKSMSSQHLNEDNLLFQNSDSHWSLTSVEIDSDSVNIDLEKRTEERNYDDHHSVQRDTLVEKFINFNKNMETLKDDTNNNNVIVDGDDIREITSNSPTLNLSSCSHSADKNIESLTNEENKDVILLKQASNEGVASHISEQENTESSVQNEKANNIIIKYHSDNPITMDDETQNNNHFCEDVPFSYYERKSIYIEGSLDNLNDDTCTGNTLSLNQRVSSDRLADCENYKINNNSL